MLILILFLLPLVSGFFLLWNKNDGIAKSTSVLVSLVQVALFAYILSLDQATLEFSVPWLSDYNVGFHLGVDNLSLIMLGLTVGGSGLILFATKDLSYSKKSLMLGLILLTEAALIGVFAAKDAFVFYFFFELALIPVFLIANFWGGKGVTKISLRMFIFTVLGSLLMLVCFVVFYFIAGTSDFSELAKIPGQLKPGISNLLFWGFFIAFAVKSPLFPFHGWLPDAYGKFPTPASMLLSGLLSKMGIYGMIRIILPLTPSSVQEYSSLIIFFCIVGLIYGSIVAIQQSRLKYLIAFSSFSHMGLMAAAVFTVSQFGLQGTIFQMVAHGFNAIGLIYIAKIIYDKTGNRKLEELGGMAYKAPKLAVFFLLILLSSVGLPLTNGFVGEFLMLRSVFDFQNIIGVVAISSIILGAVYLLRFYQKTMFGPVTSVTENIEDIGAKEMAVLVPIALIIIITGVFPNLILDFSQGFVNTLQLVK